MTCFFSINSSSSDFFSKIPNSSSSNFDMSPEVHCNLCNKCYTLGMPGPRPDIRCVQYLPKVHLKVPIEFSVPSGTSEVIDWHQRSKTLLNVETEIRHIMGWIYHIIWCWREIFKISYRCTYSWRNIKDTSWGCTSTCRLLQDTSHPSTLSRVIHFIFRP